MLLEFSVENYRSYREPAKLSLVASPADELPENLIRVEDRGLSLLKTVAIYGANGSGKSNLLSAMHFMGALIEAPTRYSLFYRPSCSPFVLDETSAEAPSRFGATFLLDGVLYEYAIEVKATEIESEKLVAYPENRPQVWFDRSGDRVKSNRTMPLVFKEIAKTIAPDRLLLGLAAAVDAPMLAAPARWLASNLRDRLDFGGAVSWSSPQLSSIANRMHEDPRFREWASALLRHADVGIRDVEVERVDRGEVTEPSNRRVKIYLVASSAKKWPKRPQSGLGLDGGAIIPQDDDIDELRPVFLHESETETPARFDLSQESHGTRRLFGMLAPFYDVLSKGELAVVDEFSASLHPMIVRELVQIFHDPQTNPSGAQLIFTTHDTNLLSGRLFRRDQVWFTEKKRSGATDLYSLHDVKGVREDDAIEKGYLRGRYGAIPFFGDFDFPPLSREHDAE